MNIARLGIVLLFAISVLFNLFTLQKPTVQAQSNLESRIQALENQVAILIARVDSLEGTPPPAIPSPTASGPAGPTASQNGNIRSGPGTQYSVSGTVVVGQILNITGYSPGGGYIWYRLANGGWIADILVSKPLPTVTVVNLPTSTPTAPPPPSTPTPPPPVCSCSGNVYNCSNFSTHNQAQACFNYCQGAGYGDVHRLDRDNDNLACESLP